MSLTVSCRDCIHPINSRQVVQWRENCKSCAEDLIARHKAAFPNHRMELSGSISDAPFAVPQRVERLFGGRKSA